MRFILIKRLLISTAVFAIVDVYVGERHHSDMQEWIIQRGRAAGCQVIVESRVLWGRDGPFFGGGFKVRLFNGLAMYGPWLAGAMSGFAAAAGTYAACRALGRRGPRESKGVTRCGRCGYALAGLKEPRCPECGLVI